MNRMTVQTLLFALLFLGVGCHSPQLPDGKTASSLIPSQLNPSNGANEDIRLWDWVTAIPAHPNVTRAEVIRPSLPKRAVALLIPEYKQPDSIQLVSNSDEIPHTRIAKVSGVNVTNFEVLHRLSLKALDEKKPVEIAVADPGENAQTFTVQPDVLDAICQGVAADQNPIALYENGNLWTVIRENGIRCKLLPQYDRESGLIHLVVSLRLLWGQERLLPIDIRVKSNNIDLRCLSAAEVLEQLYGTPIEEDKDEATPSFAEISQQVSYRMPTNYKRLAVPFQEASRRGVTQPIPALFSAPGFRYPGSPLLGDARVLSAFLLQPNLYSPMAAERTGWVLFDARNIEENKSFTVQLDLGSGLKSYRFSIPL